MPHVLKQFEESEVLFTHGDDWGDAPAGQTRIYAAVYDGSDYWFASAAVNPIASQGEAKAVETARERALDELNFQLKELYNRTGSRVVKIEQIGSEDGEQVAAVAVIDKFRRTEIRATVDMFTVTGNSVKLTTAQAVATVSSDDGLFVVRFVVPHTFTPADILAHGLDMLNAVLGRAANRLAPRLVYVDPGQTPSE